MMHGCLLGFNNDILKDTQITVLMIFKPEKTQWNLRSAFPQCSKQVKVTCVINNKITEESNFLGFTVRMTKLRFIMARVSD